MYVCVYIYIERERFLYIYIYILSGAATEPFSPVAVRKPGRAIFELGADGSWSAAVRRISRAVFSPGLRLTQRLLRKDTF